MNSHSYQPPTAETTTVLADNSLRVDGRQLVVRSGVVLPKMCVKTNEPVTEPDFQRRCLSWCPPIVGLLILLSGLLLIFVYFIARKKCVITFGASPAVRWKYRRRRIVRSVAAVALFFAIPFVAGIDSTPITCIVVVLFLVAVVSLFVGNAPLTITKHHKGEFWISGCSRDFLAGISDKEPEASKTETRAAPNARRTAGSRLWSSR